MTAVGERARRSARAADRSPAAQLLARSGLVARAVFYLVLSYLAVRVAVLHGGAAHQADAQGALQIVAGSVVGEIAIAVAAVGFLAFGAARLAAAARDATTSWRRRVLTALQGAFYLALTYAPTSFLLGQRSTGSERAQHRRAAELLGFPGGRELVVGLGLVVIGACGWQIWSAITDEQDDDMSKADTSALMRQVVRVVGTAGVAARAAVFLPVGVFLIIAAVRYAPHQAHGLDGELLRLSRYWWGQVVIFVAAAGLVTFAVYSLLEARYRDVTRSA